MSQAALDEPVSSSRYDDVLLLEDHVAAAHGLIAVVETAFPGCRQQWANTCAEAMRLLEQPWEPGLALIDLVLPDGTGMEVLRHLRRVRPETTCVVTTIYDDDEHLFPALAAGADGYLLKDQPSAGLVRQLQALGDGMPALSPRVARRMLGYFQKAGVVEAEVPSPEGRDVASSSDTAPGAAGDGGAPPAASLTRRETEVLSLIARGLQRGEVGTVLSVSENTVAKYIKDIYRKLNISSRAEAALEASRRGLL